MEDFETVAVWTGLFASIIAIVLALVAIWFSWRVDSRAHNLDKASLQRLERIEVSVDRVVSDVKQLISTAWDRMVLRNRGAEPEAAVEEEVQASTEVVERKVREVEQAFAAKDRERMEGELAALRKAVKMLETNVAEAVDDAASRRVESLRDIQYTPPEIYLETVRPDELALLKIMVESGQHLTHEQAEAIPVKPRALMREGLLKPVLTPENEERVYWLTQLAREVVGSLDSARSAANTSPSVSGGGLS